MDFSYVFDLNLTAYTNENLQMFWLNDDEEIAVVLWDITKLKTNAVLRVVVSATSNYPASSGVITQSYFKIQFTPATCTGISTITASTANSIVSTYDLYSQSSLAYIVNNFASNKACDMVRITAIYDPVISNPFLSTQNLT